MIGIIDYKAGNAPSVLNAVQHLGYEAKLVTTGEQIKQADVIILPGVGSAQATVDSLKELGCFDELEDAVLNKKVPFIGICIGLQVLFDHSEEGDVDCFGWIKGKVKKFNTDNVRVPQMGWNRVDFMKDNPVTDKSSDYFYFVNSYYCVPENKDDILAVTDYDGGFVSAIAHENIYATQFHVEKSGQAGLDFLKGFLDAGLEGKLC